MTTLLQIDSSISNGGGQSRSVDGSDRAGGGKPVGAGGEVLGAAVAVGASGGELLGALDRDGRGAGRDCNRLQGRGGRRVIAAGGTASTTGYESAHAQQQGNQQQLLHQHSPRDGNRVHRTLIYGQNDIRIIFATRTENIEEKWCLCTTMVQVVVPQGIPRSTSVLQCANGEMFCGRWVGQFRSGGGPGVDSEVPRR